MRNKLTSEDSLTLLKKISESNEEPIKLPKIISSSSSRRKIEKKTS